MNKEMSELNDGKSYLFFDSLTGEIIIREARSSLRLMPTVERVIEVYPKLNERESSSFGVLVLDYDDYSQDFAESKGYRVNPETKELEFSYPDPNEPEAPPIYQKSLSEAVSENINYLLDVDFRLMMVELGIY